MSDPSASVGFVRQFARLANPYWREHPREAWSLTVLLITLTMAQVVVPVMLNQWSANFFNAIEARSMAHVVHQMGVLGLILGLNVVITVSHLAIKRLLQVRWRQWLTHQLLAEWMNRGHQYQVAYLDGSHDNPDGRIAEDVRLSTEVAIDLAHSFLYCLLLLISFTQILWTLSGVVTLQLWGVDLNIPGHMVFIALLYAGAGTAGAMMFARPLVRAVDRRQTVEANFRFGLVRARENADGIALVHGEFSERARFKVLFQAVKDGWNRQTRALARIFTFSSGYSVLSVGFPLLVAAPRYISASISLGELMQIAQAFQQMAAALSWPIDNLPRAAEWGASVERVLNLHNALMRLEQEKTTKARIQVVRNGQAGLTFDRVTIATPNGRAVLSDVNLTIEPRDRVLLTGDRDTAVKLLKVVVELWPWGSGTVTLPHDESVFFMPQRPYLPSGTLRAALCYPLDDRAYATDQIITAFQKVGLEALVPSLDVVSDNWAHEISGSDLQRLGFARMLLHRPRWIFIQQATEALDAQTEERMMDLLETDDFSQSTVVTVGHNAALIARHQRLLSVERNPDGTRSVVDISP